MSTTDTAKHRSLLLRWTRDPLFLFLLIGAAVFAADVWLSGDDDRAVMVTQPQIDRLAALWQTQTGRPPSDTELTALIDDHVREEIMVREAKRLDLDQDDTIIRRRLAQKLMFLTEDVATLAAPADDELKRYFDDHRARYATPAVITFSHIYFSPDRREDAGVAAKQALAQLDPEAWRQTGDPFMLGRTYAHASVARIERDFGDAFAAALQPLSADGAWQGPVESVFGFHLLRIDAKSPAQGRTFDAVAARVTADFDAERRAAANKAYFDDLKAQYDVVLP